MKRNYFQDEKLKYEDIEIPDELLLMVRQTVAADRRKRAAIWRVRVIRMAGSAAAILFLCLTIGVNSSYAFAETAVKIPVVRTVAKAVVVRDYRPDIIAVYEEHKASGKTEEAPESGQIPDTVEPVVSGNDAISEDAALQQTTDQPAEQDTPQAADGFDGWKSDMTLDKFREVTEIYTPEMEERYASAPERLRTILLAVLPEEDVALYGYHEGGKVTGTALRVKDTYQYFDWNYMNESKKLPDITLTDADGDGEEEIVVLLYNGTMQKKEISKEDIAEPGSDAGEAGKESTETKETKKDEAVSDPAKQRTAEDNGNVPETINAKPAGKAADSSDTADPSAGETEDKTQVTISGDNPEEETVPSSVSGNDIVMPEEEKEKPEQQPGELWVISTKESWSAALLSVDDYESQILHRLKAEFDETAGTVQIYLMEEPFGEPVKLELQAEQKENLTYEAINLAPERTFEADGGITLCFKIEASFRDDNRKRITCPVDLSLKADILLESASLTVENIREQR